MITTADPIPTVNDTDLVDDEPVIIDGDSFVVSSVENTPPGSNVWATTFMITMESDVGNTLGGDDFRNFTEMGLFSENGTMYARKTYPSFVKLAGRKLVVFWTIAF